MGYFYVIQPLPGDAPWHLKLGYSENAARRVLDYRVLCPDAQILKVWPCVSMGVEADAIAYVERVGFERIGAEVFCCLHPERLVACLDNFFQVVLPGTVAATHKDIAATWRGWRGKFNPTEDGYITRSALATKLGMTLEKVTKLIEDGEIPGYVSDHPNSMQTHIYVRVSDVDEYLKKWSA